MCKIIAILAGEMTSQWRHKLGRGPKSRIFRAFYAKPSGHTKELENE